ncbi:TetR/AcrR family transcriptional regulator [Nonomuraea fuscirosea]|uniref:TetR/AcrR family transcriptional regulator n=1 Tax=Nonomuraea fuscirosea TaxID=1291556 RepID=UPI002DD7F8FC|nr:TetR/AcrR family transcriptional regulator [Nonomuraea fuscirosea]WSA52383.1 TetR/AcrR family transcriptional regulator [Nonomuraea fuscirosea]
MRKRRNMPKIVDHDTRRRHIAEAVHRVIHARGMESVSLREVAAEAGMSMGAVQYYVTTKDQMLLLALERIAIWIGERVAAVAADRTTPLDVLRATILELLPLDEERRYLNRIGLAFQASSVVSEDQAAAMRAGYAALLSFLTDQISAAQSAGQLAAHLEAAKEASLLYAFAQGIVNPTLVGHYTPDDVAALLDHHLSRLRAE